MIVYKVTGSTICIAEQEKIVAGDVNTHYAAFNLSNDWDGLGITAVFVNGQTTVEAILSEGQCVIPWEVLEKPGYLYVSIYGVSTSGEDMEQKISTISPGIPVRKGGENDPDNHPSPTPDIYEQMLSALGKKQDKLKGQPPEVVTFDENGNAIAKDMGFEKMAEETKEAADKANESAKQAKLSETEAKKWSELAEQGASTAGWFYVEGGEDGILYMIRADNTPNDFDLSDNGEGVLIATYGN